MTIFGTLFFSMMMLGLFLGLRKRARLRDIQAMFRRFNEQDQNREVILSWIREKDTTGRLLDTLDYLTKIESEDLAVKVFDAFDPHEFKDRHIRVFACKAYKKSNKRAEGLAMAQTLVEDYPGDDSVLDICIATQLHFGALEEAKKKLLPRLEVKAKGTTFTRHHAHLIAAEGDPTRAVEILEKVTAQDYALYRNTLAPAHRRLIYEQYTESQRLLDEIKAQLNLD